MSQVDFPVLTLQVFQISQLTLRFFCENLSSKERLGLLTVSKHTMSQMIDINAGMNR